MDNQELDENTKQLIENLRQHVVDATNLINNIELDKIVQNHIDMEELKSKIGVK